MKCKTCDEEECICDQLPQHVKEMLALHHSEHGQYVQGLVTMLWGFIALVFIIAAWSAGYPPWFFITQWWGR